MGEALVVTELVDVKGKPAYDVLSYMDDGTVCAAGTTDAVAWCVQGGYESDDEALAEALREAMKGGIKPPPAKRPRKTTYG
jgi:hypothetical protein